MIKAIKKRNRKSKNATQEPLLSIESPRDAETVISEYSTDNSTPNSASSSNYTPLSTIQSPQGFFSNFMNFGNTTRRRKRRNSHFSQESNLPSTKSQLSTGSETSEYFTDEDENDPGFLEKCQQWIRKFLNFIYADFMIILSIFRMTSSKSSKEKEKEKKYGTYKSSSFSQILGAALRLSFLLFLILLIFVSSSDSSSLINYLKFKLGLTFGGSFQSLGGFSKQNKNYKNVWEDYDYKWAKGHLLEWSDIREILPRYDFSFLLNSTSEFDQFQLYKETTLKSSKSSKKNSRVVKLSYEQEMKFKVMKKVEEAYKTKKKEIFPKNNKYLLIKSTDLIQIKRPAVRTKRADEPRATRTFGCVRDGCRGLAIEDLLDRGWQMRFRAAENNDTFKDINYRVTFLLTDTTHLTIMQKHRPDLFKKVYKDYAGKCYLSAFDGGDAIGGNKGQQIQVKEKFVRQYGCKFNDLNIAPKSYRLYRKDECEEFLSLTADLDLSWILKPETGSQGAGITFHSQISSVINKVPQFFPCKGGDNGKNQKKMKATERYLVQQYLQRPLLLKKSKFDVRVYMLVASSNPYLVFYHEGYLRRSLTEYSASSKDRKVYLTNTHFQSMKKNFKLSEHIWPFQMMQEHLSSFSKTGSHYVETILNPYIKKVALFVFHSARKKFVKRKGTFHVFGIDFMIDSDYHTWFIEANGYPGFTWSLNFDSRSMVEEMFNLVQQVHENPRFYMLMSPGDRYGGFEMIFNELEEERARKASTSVVSKEKDSFELDFNMRGLYNPCLEFRHNLGLSKPLRASNRLLSQISGKKGRTDKLKNLYNFISNIEYQENKKIIKPSSSHVNEKLWILRAEKEHFKEHGCDRNKLRYTPDSFILEDLEECNEFFKSIKQREESDSDTETVSEPETVVDRERWVVKSKQGVQIYGSKEELYAVYGNCIETQNKGVIVQKLIEDRILFQNKWWDMKVFWLISNTQPFMVWYHQGFLRTSKIHLNKQLKESADLLLQQNKKQKQREREQLREKRKDGDDEEDSYDDVQVEDKREGEEEKFTIEELLEDLEPELGFSVSKITQFKEQEASNEESSSTSSSQGLNIAGLKNIHFSSDNNEGFEQVTGALGSLLGSVEKWEPDEYSTGSVWQVGENYMSFNEFQDKLAKEMVIGSKYLDSVFDVFVKRTLNLVFNSIKESKNKTKNSYELYESDFIIDEHYNIHYLDSKVVDPSLSFPSFEDKNLNEEKIHFLKELAQLVLETQTAPVAFSRMLKGDSYGNWRLIYSELEEIQRGREYNKEYKPCSEFKRNLNVHKGSIFKNSWLNNYAEKRHAANKREMNKYIHNKWNVCKYKQTRETMSSCIRNTISYRYKIYIQKEGIDYQDGYVENRIRDLVAKREAERNK